MKKVYRIVVSVQWAVIRLGRAEHRRDLRAQSAGCAPGRRAVHRRHQGCAFDGPSQIPRSAGRGDPRVSFLYARARPNLNERCARCAHTPYPICFSLASYLGVRMDLVQDTDSCILISHRLLNTSAPPPIQWPTTIPPTNCCFPIERWSQT